MNIIAWALIALIILATFWAPFTIGEKRDPYTANHYAIQLLGSLAVVLVCGRVLGLW